MFSISAITMHELDVSIVEGVRWMVHLTQSVSRVETRSHQQRFRLHSFESSERLAFLKLLPPHPFSVPARLTILGRPYPMSLRLAARLQSVFPSLARTVVNRAAQRPPPPPRGAPASNALHSQEH